ncbi:hypothetical protein C8R46DRAFT_205746 [Mycena filopes]|nr:hypothetical protein C8R46DRAFT_205746 [Mycena filopes]
MATSPRMRSGHLNPRRRALSATPEQADGTGSTRASSPETLTAARSRTPRARSKRAAQARRAQSTTRETTLFDTEPFEDESTILEGDGAQVRVLCIASRARPTSTRLHPNTHRCLPCKFDAPNHDGANMRRFQHPTSRKRPDHADVPRRAPHPLCRRRCLADPSPSSRARSVSAIHTDKQATTLASVTFSTTLDWTRLSVDTYSPRHLFTASNLGSSTISFHMN